MNNNKKNNIKTQQENQVMKHYISVSPIRPTFVLQCDGIIAQVLSKVVCPECAEDNFAIVQNDYGIYEVKCDDVWSGFTPSYGQPDTIPVTVVEDCCIFNDDYSDTSEFSEFGFKYAQISDGKRVLIKDYVKLCVKYQTEKSDQDAMGLSYASHEKIEEFCNGYIVK